MMDNNQHNMADFSSRINNLYEKIMAENINYYDLLGLLKTATYMEVDQAYKRNMAEFSPENINQISDPEIKKRAHSIVERLKRAYEVLSNYDKKAEYEKRGFREASPEDAIEEDPVEKARDIYRKAKVLYNQQNYRLVISALEEAISLDDKKSDYFYLLGVCQTRFPELKRDAEKNLLKAMEMEPWNAEHLVALGMLFYSEKLFQRAESYFRKALEKEPNHSLARKKLLEISGPDKKGMDTLKDNLKKYMPTLFGKKK